MGIDRTRRTLVVIAALTLVLCAWVAPAAAQEGRQERGKVLVVTMPRVTWDDIAVHRPPVLLDLLSRSAVAALSVRSVGSDTGVGEGYASLGAGNRAAADPGVAGQALAPDEPFEGTDAGDAFTRRTGLPADGAVLHLLASVIAEDNDAELYDTEPGALADALHEAGLSTAVVANADTVSGERTVRRREAALAVMDSDGVVDHGEVRPSVLLADAPGRPFGVRLDRRAVRQAVDEAWAESAVTVLDLSDFERAEIFAPTATADAGELALERAMADGDRLLADALSLVDLSRDLVVVAGPVAPNGPDQLTVFAVAGPGFDPGYATSGSTRRSGYVTLPDVAPTILRHLGVEEPNSMTGAPIRSDKGGSPDLATVEHLEDKNEAARFRDSTTRPASTTYIVLQCVVYGLALLILLGWWRAEGVGGLVSRFLLLVMMAVPAAAFLAGLVEGHNLATGAFLLALYATAVVLALAAAGVGRLLAGRLGRAGPFAAPLLLVAFLYAVLVVDVVTGGRLQIDTVFGYSAIVAGRFAGYGNQAFALVAISAVVLAAGAWTLVAGRQPDERAAGRGRGAMAAAVAVLVVAVLVDGHPSFGSDVGGVLAMVPAFTLVVLILAGARLHWRRVAATVGATAVIIGVFAGLDLARPPEDRTHLGRFVSRTTEGGAGDFFTVIGRKLQANLTSFGSVWIAIVIAAIVLLVALSQVGRPLDRLDAVPGMRACLAGGLAACVLGFAVNDSGIAVPGMMLSILVPYLLWLLLAGVGEAPADG